MSLDDAKGIIEAANYYKGVSGDRRVGGQMSEKEKKEFLARAREKLAEEKKKRFGG